jgi:hypothetical protein
MVYVLYIHGKPAIKSDNPVVIDEQLAALGPTLAKHCETKVFTYMDNSGIIVPNVINSN